MHRYKIGDVPFSKYKQFNISFVAHSATGLSSEFSLTGVKKFSDAGFEQVTLGRCLCESSAHFRKIIVYEIVYVWTALITIIIYLPGNETKDSSKSSLTL